MVRVRPWRAHPRRRRRRGERRGEFHPNRKKAPFGRCPPPWRGAPVAAHATPAIGSFVLVGGRAGAVRASAPRSRFPLPRLAHARSPALTRTSRARHRRSPSSGERIPMIRTSPRTIRPRKSPPPRRSRPDTRPTRPTPPATRPGPPTLTPRARAPRAS